MQFADVLCSQYVSVVKIPAKGMSPQAPQLLSTDQALSIDRAVLRIGRLVDIVFCASSLVIVVPARAARCSAARLAIVLSKTDRGRIERVRSSLSTQAS